MIFHASIEAENPKKVAEVFAEILSGVATPFPPVVDGAWIAMAGDDRRSAVEVYPMGTDLVKQDDTAPPGSLKSAFYGVPVQRASRGSACHLAIGSELDQDAILAIAQREGWPAQYYSRGGAFGVVEIWIEDRLMIEVLTPEMQQEYVALMNIPAWTGLMKQIGVMS